VPEYRVLPIRARIFWIWRVICVVCGAIRFDFAIEDFFAGLPIAGDAINAPTAKQLTKITPFVFMHFLLL
jgi:hypothetical protein